MPFLRLLFRIPEYVPRRKFDSVRHHPLFGELPLFLVAVMGAIRLDLDIEAEFPRSEDIDLHIAV